MKNSVLVYLIHRQLTKFRFVIIKFGSGPTGTIDSDNYKVSTLVLYVLLGLPGQGKFGVVIGMPISLCF